MPAASNRSRFILFSCNHPHDGAAGVTAERSSIPHSALPHQNSPARSPLTINHLPDRRHADQLSSSESRAVMEHLSRPESERLRGADADMTGVSTRLQTLHLNSLANLKSAGM